MWPDFKAKFPPHHPNVTSHYHGNVSPKPALEARW